MSPVIPDAPEVAVWVLGWMVVGVGCTGPAAPEPAAPEAPATRKKTVPKPSTGGTSELAMPAAKACLPPPDGEGLGDAGSVSSRGLSTEEVSAAMRAFLPTTLRCTPEGEVLEGTVVAELRVGCDGRVARVDIADGGGLPDPVVACVKDTLRYAPFPAHDVPDGFAFEFPLTFSR